MARNSIRFNCGCGFRTDNYLDAALHADQTGHNLDCLGRVFPDQAKKKPVRILVIKED